MTNLVSLPQTLAPLVNHPLSKSQLKLTKQCPLALQLYRNRPKLMADLSLEAKRIIDVGNQVGELAQAHFKDGFVVDAPHQDLELALQQTRDALENKNVANIFEATLELRKSNDTTSPESDLNPDDVSLQVKNDVLAKNARRFASNNLFVRIDPSLVSELKSKSYPEFLKLVDNLLNQLSKDTEFLTEQIQNFTVHAEAIQDHLLHTYYQSVIKRLESLLRKVTEYENKERKREPDLDDYKTDIANILSFAKFSAENLSEDSFNLWEVKSTTNAYTRYGRPKDKYLFDLAIQLYVAEQLGFNIYNAGIMHLSRDYVHPADGRTYDVSKLFDFSALVGQARALVPQVEALFKKSQELAANPKPENVEMGPHCDSRDHVACSFIPYCETRTPADHVSKLYYMTERIYNHLIELGIHTIADFPDDLDSIKHLRKDQKRIIKVHQTDTPYIDKTGITDYLKQFENVNTIHFIDFESILQSLPIVRGTRVSQQVPGQFSNHILDKNSGKLSHDEFLFNPENLTEQGVALEALRNIDHFEKVYIVLQSEQSLSTEDLISKNPKLAKELKAIQAKLIFIEDESKVPQDEKNHKVINLQRTDITHPMRLFALQLIRTTREPGPLVVWYASYEKTRMKELAEMFPEYTDEINNIIDRVYDLREPFYDFIYKKEYNHSYSIKDILKAEFPELSYDRLDIKDGYTASLLLEELFYPETTDERAKEIRDHLLVYCGLDTYSMVALMMKLYDYTDQDRPYLEKLHWGPAQKENA